MRDGECMMPYAGMADAAHLDTMDKIVCGRYPLSQYTEA